jgi:hypothetical protein
VKKKNVLIGSMLTDMENCGTRDYRSQKQGNNIWIHVCKAMITLPDRVAEGRHLYWELEEVEYDAEPRFESLSCGTDI